jgi:hypothetical protein
VGGHPHPVRDRLSTQAYLSTGAPNHPGVRGGSGRMIKPWTKYRRARFSFGRADTASSGSANWRASASGVPPDRTVHLPVPHERRLQDREFVLVERTRRIPDPVFGDGLPLAPVPRALLTRHGGSGPRTGAGVAGRGRAAVTHHGRRTRRGTPGGHQACNRDSTPCPARAEARRALGSASLRQGTWTLGL